jgi:hypothetical protein
LISRYCSIIGVTRAAGSAAGWASTGAGDAGNVGCMVIKAFSSEVGTGSREENASK